MKQINPNKVIHNCFMSLSKWNKLIQIKLIEKVAKVWGLYAKFFT
jgi:hypothetical protein